MTLFLDKSFYVIVSDYFPSLIYLFYSTDLSDFRADDGMKLDVQVIKTLENADLQICADACIDETKCRSFNYDNNLKT